MELRRKTEAAMTEQPLRSRDPAAQPSYAGGDPQDKVVDTARRARARRLRNGLLLANIAAWLIIIAAIKWLAF
jgi:hypothetical protein